MALAGTVLGADVNARLDQLNEREKQLIEKLESVRQRERYIETRLEDLRKRKQLLLNKQGDVVAPGTRAATPAAEPPPTP